MFSQLEEVEQRFEALTEQMADPAFAQDIEKLTSAGKERAKMEPIVESFRELRRVLEELKDAKSMLETESDEDMRDMAKAEIKELTERQEALQEKLELALLPKDPLDEKNVVLEIRAGAGGDEASLFAGELLDLYSRYAGLKGWKVDVMSKSAGSAGGFKEIICSVEGNEVYSSLKWEGGVHRVQRVPATESQGRIHTSTVTVAVMPEAEEVDVVINSGDLRIDTMRASGHGGQSVNTTDSAVRIVHLPTNTMVVCSDEKSQHKNKAKAMKVLRARLYDKFQAAAAKEIGDERRSMVGTGDRSEKIRTYNFPQDRISDHRINLTLHNLPKVMAGDLDALITPLRTHAQAESLKKNED